MKLKRKIWAALTAMALAVTGITPIAALAEGTTDTLYVDSGNTNGTPDGTSDNPYTTIQAAADAAATSAADEVVIKVVWEDSYDEYAPFWILSDNITVEAYDETKKPVIKTLFSGEDWSYNGTTYGGTLDISSNQTYKLYVEQPCGGINLQATNVTLNNLKIKSYGVMSTDKERWYAAPIGTLNNNTGTVANKVTITGCEITYEGEDTGFSSWGMFVAGVQNLTVTNTTVSDFNTAIYLAEPGNAEYMYVTITGCTITGCGDEAINIQPYNNANNKTQITLYTIVITNNTIDNGIIQIWDQGAQSITMDITLDENDMQNGEIILLQMDMDEVTVTADEDEDYTIAYFSAANAIALNAAATEDGGVDSFVVTDWSSFNDDGTVSGTTYVKSSSDGTSTTYEGSDGSSLTLASSGDTITHTNSTESTLSTDEGATAETGTGKYITASEAVTSAISAYSDTVTSVARKDVVKYTSITTDEDSGETTELVIEIEPMIKFNDEVEYSKLNTSGTKATVNIPVSTNFDNGTTVMIKHEYDGGTEYFFATVADSVVSVTTYKGFSTWTITPAGDVADEVNVEFEEVTPNAKDGKYYVKLVGVDSSVLYRFSTAQLQFVFNDDTTTYDITKIGALSIASAEEEYSPYISITDEGDGVYLFNVNGSKDGSGDEISDITGNEIILGIATISGIGTFKPTVDETYENYVEAAVYTTNDDNNIVRTYLKGGSVSNGAAEGALHLNEDVNDNDGSGYIDDEVSLNKTTLTINVMFPNTVNDNEYAYESMTIGIDSLVLDEMTAYLGSEDSGYIADSTGTKIDDGSVSMAYYAVDNGDNPTDYTCYSVTVPAALNYAVTLTFKGDGYRTYRTTIVPNDADGATVTVWNNVMDDSNAIEVADGCDDTDTETVTFLAGDICMNGAIDLYDLSAVVSYFGKDDITTLANYADYIKYDLNRDNKIDSKDIAMVLVSWGK